MVAYKIGILFFTDCFVIMSRDHVPRFGLQIGEYTDVETNNVEAFYKGFEEKYSSDIKALYAASLVVSKLTKHVKVTKNEATIGMHIICEIVSATFNHVINHDNDTRRGYSM